MKTISKNKNKRVTLTAEQWKDVIAALGVADGVYDSIAYGAIAESIARQLFKDETITIKREKIEKRQIELSALQNKIFGFQVRG
jgi:hypothetical protein